jgi:hypothetical protein
MAPHTVRRAALVAILLMAIIGVVVAVPQRDRLIRWATFD